MSLVVLAPYNQRVPSITQAQTQQTYPTDFSLSSLSNVPFCADGRIARNTSDIHRGEKQAFSVKPRAETVVITPRVNTRVGSLLERRHNPHIKNPSRGFRSQQGIFLNPA